MWEFWEVFEYVFLENSSKWERLISKISKSNNMNCPRCKSVLKVETLKEASTVIEVNQCLNCGGTWFDARELASLDSVIEPVMMEIRSLPNEEEQMVPLNCPKCEEHPVMQKIEHVRDNKVIMDVCPTCKGIWLDKGELKAIQQESFVLSVGKVVKWMVGLD